MLTSPNFKMTFSFTIVSNIAINTLKFASKVWAKIYGNGHLEFKKATQSIFGLQNNFHIALWVGFPIGLLKTESGFIVRSVEIGLGRWTLVVTVISVDAYPFLAFSDLTCHLEDTGISVFWLHCATW